MRDLFLLCFIPLAIYFILKSPFIGVALSAWTSIFAPHAWVWGFGASLRVNLVVTVVTVMSFILNKNKIKPIFNITSGLMFLFLIWGTFSTIFAKGNTVIAWFEWDLFWKVIFLFFLVTFTVNTKHRVEVTLWAVVLGGGLIGCNEGLKYILSAGGHSISGPAGTRIGDRNDLSLALNMLLPISLYLYSNTKNKWLKIILLAILATNIACIVGSFSRGGFIGLCIVGIFYFLKGKNKTFILAGSLTVALALPLLVPQNWFDRMNTIENAAEDLSFIGRVQAWKQAVLMANDNPILGAGFKAGQDNYLWRFYEHDFAKFDHLIQTSHISFPFAKAAHSIYFQVLGDLGYCGLLIYLCMLWSAYRNFSFAKRNAGENKWLGDLANSLKVSMIVFAVSGALLSQPYFDLTFIILALSVVLYTLAREQALVTNSKLDSENLSFSPKRTV